MPILNRRFRRSAQRAYTKTEKEVKRVGDIFSPDINIPQPDAPPVMPIPDEEEQRRASRRRLARSRASGRGGRKSSILSAEDGALG